MRSVILMFTLWMAAIQKESSHAFWATKQLQLLRVSEKKSLTISQVMLWSLVIPLNVWNGIASFVNLQTLTFVQKCELLKARV